MGYFLNRKKSVYLLGKCGNADLARRRKQQLIRDFGLSEEIIRIHPNDGGDDMRYGATVLGSFLGKTGFVYEKLGDKAAEVKGVCESITTVNSKQIQFQMLRWCFSKMLIYWQRNLATSNHDIHHP